MPTQVPHAVPSVTGPLSFGELVRRAAQRLVATGWHVRYVQFAEATAWHVVASNGTKWRIVQVLSPGTGAAARHEGRQLLGATAMVPARLGTMEQCLAHVQPNGRLAFGTDLLSGYAWGGEDSSADGLRDRLARLAEQAGAITDAASARKAG